MRPLFNRRRILQTGGLGLALALHSKNSNAAPSTKTKGKKLNTKFTQAPGFFRFKLGDFLISIVSDGALEYPSNILGKNVPEAQLKSFLKSNYCDPETVTMHMNCCIVDTGKYRILVDPGAGSNFENGTGRFINNLKASGYTPDMIDAVIISHAHPEQFWSVAEDKTKKELFRNATYYVHAAEWDFWTNKETGAKTPDEKKMATTKKKLLAIAPKTTRFKPGKELFTGIMPIDTSGHTPGHISLQVRSKQESMIICGDILTHQFVSFEHPSWQYSIDMKPEKAAKARLQILSQAAKEESLIVGFHLAFPGVGYAARKGDTYRWIPKTWQWTI